MLRLSRKAMLALEAVLDVAYNARPDPVQSKEITRRQGVPQRYLEQILQQLVHEGVLKGVRGPRGGYILARERRRITVGDIVRVVDALDREDENASGEKSTSELATEVIHPLWEDVLTDLMSRLDSITIEDLCQRARERRVPAEADRRSDFTI